MTDLESEIDALRELDSLRVESEQLRKDGIEVLTTILKKAYKYNTLYELARVSMTFWELPDDPPKQLNEWKKKLENLELAEHLVLPFLSPLFTPIILSFVSYIRRTLPIGQLVERGRTHKLVWFVPMLLGNVFGQSVASLVS